MSCYKIKNVGSKEEELTWIQDVKEYMTIHLGEKMGLATIADIAGLEKYQFIRSFKRHVGLTPFQFIVLNRVLRGKEMLKQGMPVVDAALEAGFYDQSNFTNYFKMYVGDTPKVYQKSCNIFQENS